MRSKRPFLMNFLPATNIDSIGIRIAKCPCSSETAF